MTDDKVSDEIKNSEEEFKKNLAHYRQVMNYMGANAPIEVLCLPLALQNALIRDGCVRVYDLISRDLTKIKGIGSTRLEVLTARLDQFFMVSI